MIKIEVYKKKLKLNKLEKKPNFLINKFLYLIFYFKKYFLKFFNFPFGISIYAIIKK